MKTLIYFFFILVTSQYSQVNSQSRSRKKDRNNEASMVDELNSLKGDLNGLTGDLNLMRAELKSVTRENKKLRHMVTKLHDKKQNEYEERMERNEGDVTIVSTENDPTQQLLTLLSQRSCHEWKTMGFYRSGYYTIDPDGKGIGEPPFSVYCDMMTGYTFIHHNKEGNQNVSSCTGLSCDTQTISYNATKTQIEALITISDSCQQYIQIDCLESALYNADEALSWWEDRHGNKQTFWFGDDTSTKGCSCGFSKSCINPRNLCNCDSVMVGHWLRDSGYVSNNSVLPISRLHFGTKDGVHLLQMGYELGPLRCYGRKRVSYPANCRDIWISGLYVSGYYTLGDPDNVYQVYCNMSNISDERYLGQNVFQHRSPVMFFASLNQKLTTVGTVKFDNVSINVGKAYNPNTGTFTAPHDGVYDFHFIGLGNSVTWAGINKNGLNVGSTQTSSSGWNSFTLSSTLQLKAGDSIRIHLGTGTLHGLNYNGYWSSFNGKLIESFVGHLN